MLHCPLVNAMIGNESGVQRVSGVGGVGDVDLNGQTNRRLTLPTLLSCS